MGFESIRDAGRRMAAIYKKIDSAEPSLGRMEQKVIAATASAFVATSLVVGATAPMAPSTQDLFDMNNGPKSTSDSAQSPAQTQGPQIPSDPNGKVILPAPAPAPTPAAPPAAPPVAAEPIPAPAPQPPPPPPPAPGTVAPNVRFVPSPNFNSREGTDIDTIILHHTATNNWEGDLRVMSNPNSQVSAHYLVTQEGEIIQLVPDEMRAWHAGEGQVNGDFADVNSRSIGIEIENAGDNVTPFTEPQYKALESLVPYLAKKYQVPMSNLQGHRDISIPKGRKLDPADNFDWNRIRAAVAPAIS